ncbi:MAG: hypothetical protein ABI615_11150 [Chthoniobacterales bacterium]
MIYNFALKDVGLTVAILLIVTHGFALLSPKSVQTALRHFPRNKQAGTALLLIAAIWSFYLIKTMDLGEFSPMRTIMLVAIPVAAVLTWKFVDEFLPVRALGMIALLASEPLLESAYLKAPDTRLLFVILAYVWVIAGLFWVGMPYTLRNQIRWVTENTLRWNAAVFGGLAYGILLLLCAIFFY